MGTRGLKAPLRLILINICHLGARIHAAVTREGVFTIKAPAVAFRNSVRRLNLLRGANKILRTFSNAILPLYLSLHPSSTILLFYFLPPPSPRAMQ